MPKCESNFIEITLWHGFSPINCYIFSEHLFPRTPLNGCFWNDYTPHKRFSQKGSIINVAQGCDTPLKLKSLTF